MRRLIKVIALLVVILPAICHATPVNWNYIEDNDIGYYMQTGELVYELGEDVEMLFRVTNLREEEVTIYCSRSPEFNFLVRDGEETIWRSNQWFKWYSPGVTLLPGEFTELAHDWDMIDDNDNLVEPGIYDVVGVMYTYPQIEVAVPISIIPEPVSFLLFSLGLLIVRPLSRRKE